MVLVIEEEARRRSLFNPFLGQSDLVFWRLLEKLPAGAYMCDSAGLITYFNQRAVEMWGRAPKLNDPRDRFCGSFKLFTVDGEPIAHDQCWMALAIRENKPYNSEEIVIEREDGSRRTVLAHANPIHDKAGQLLGAMNVLVDISDRKVAEKILQRAYRQMEGQVAQRTAALAASNEALKAEIAERKQAQERTRRQAAHAQAQAQAAIRLNAQLDVQAVLDTVCQITADVLQAPVVLVYLFDEKGRDFQFRVGMGLPDTLAQPPPAIPWSLYSRFNETDGQVRRFLSAEEVERCLGSDIPSQLALQRAMVVDLAREGQLVGCVVVLTDERESAFAEDELTLLEGLAAQAAQAIANARLYQEVQVRQKDLQRLTQRIITAEEEERKRLSRELHDSVGQTATALLINLSLLETALPREDEKLNASVDSVSKLASRIHSELRSMSHMLRPPALEMIGLNAALRGLCQDLDKLVKQTISYVGATLPPLPDVLTVAFYRFAQEALNNAIKHSEADSIQVRLSLQGDLLTVTVEDDGVGIDFTRAEADGSGVGLISMRERLEMVGGEMKIEAGQDTGTRLVAWRRLPQQEAGADS